MSNPHLESVKECLDPEGDFNWTNSDLANIGARLEAQAHATLALAFEQRTANLIALFDANGEKGLHEIDYPALRNLILTRLGLGDTK